jgi:hypothetical protein
MQDFAEVGEKVGVTATRLFTHGTSSVNYEAIVRDGYFKSTKGG